MRWTTIVVFLLVMVVSTANSVLPQGDWGPSAIILAAVGVLFACAAILARRLRESRIAHQYFQQAGDSIYTDSRALHEFAQTKIRLAQEARGQQRPAWREVNRRLLVEARGLLERVIQMDASPTRHAWAWRDLARSLNWLRAPASEVQAAYENALRLLPDESRFAVELRQFRERQSERSHRAARGGRNGHRGRWQGRGR